MTIEIEKQDLQSVLQDFVKLIHHHNEAQGKNGCFFGYATRDIATIRSILLKNDISISDATMDSIISTVADTLLISKEGILTKLDAVSLLICIVFKYPDDFKRNNHLFEELFRRQEEIETGGHEFIFSNIHGIALRICLQFLFAAMGIDTYASILELMPYIQNDVPTTIQVARVIAEYLETSVAASFPKNIEAIILQNVLQWLCSSRLDIRRNATRILLRLASNPENIEIVNRQVVTRIDTDNVYIKNLILRNIYEVKGIAEPTREYIISKCENDANFVVRMVCKEEKDKHILGWNECT